MDLNFQTYGAGHPIIVLHGLFGSLTNWNTISKALSERYQVVAVDLRNHGGSPHDDTMNYAVMADDLRALMQTQGFTSAHVLGHSMGGKAAMQLALSAPELVDRLIVVDIAPRAYPRHHDEIFAALNSLDLAAYSNRAELDQALAVSLRDRAVRHFLLTNAVRDPDGGFSWRLNLPVIERDYEHLMIALSPEGTFSRPTLFIRGERSDYISPADEAQIRVMFPRATITTIPNAGHWVHAEAPQALLESVMQFLDDSGQIE